MKHLGPLALFAALAVAWTWPLTLHLGNTLPGDPGDNYSFLWNLWWMRHVLATPGLAYFQTDHLFYPFGTNLVDSSHTALPALVAATVFAKASVVTAQNVLVLAYVFANMAVMYALAWDITGARRPAILAAVLFGLSPYLAAHLIGHFELMAAWVLPAFALLWRRALRAASLAAALAAGLVLVAAAYIVYYYVIYMALFAFVYLLASTGAFGVAWISHQLTPALRAVRWCCAGATLACALGALAITVTGGGTIAIGALTISATTPQNLLTVMWVVVLAWLLITWRPVVSVDPKGLAALRRSVAPLAVVAAVFIVGTLPLTLEVAHVMRSGGYVTPEYQWRSAPHGVDLIAPLLGHPLHPLTQAISRRAYAAAHSDVVEAIGWMGVVPVLLILWLRPRADARREDRLWLALAAVFGVWALGPYLMIGGLDPGLKLPAILLRFVPIVANARMPGRAMLGVFLALAVMVAIRMSGATGRLRSPAMQWLVIALVVFEYADAPIPLTTIDTPPIYRALAAQGPGAVCEVPFGFGGGLSTGVGAQDRRILYYATLHEHPLVGAYIGRMPSDAEERYESNPLLATLLHLSGGATDPAIAIGSDPPPCRYLVVDRASSSAELQSYVAHLPADHLATDDQRDLYRLQ